MIEGLFIHLKFENYFVSYGYIFVFKYDNRYRNHFNHTGARVAQ